MATKNQPVKEARLGRIKAVIWKNPGSNGNGPLFNTTLARLYKESESDTWKESGEPTNFFRNGNAPFSAIRQAGHHVQQGIRKPDGCGPVASQSIMIGGQLSSSGNGRCAIRVCSTRLRAMFMIRVASHKSSERGIELMATALALLSEESVTCFVKAKPVRASGRQLLCHLRRSSS